MVLRYFDRHLGAGTTHRRWRSRYDHSLVGGQLFWRDFVRGQEYVTIVMTGFTGCILRRLTLDIVRGSVNPGRQGIKIGLQIIPVILVAGR